jgi:hypothetical protein
VERIELLVVRHPPLDVCKLSYLYRQAFDELLDYKGLGFKKLKPFLATIPSIEMQEASKGSPLRLALKKNSHAATIARVQMVSKMKLNLNSSSEPDEVARERIRGLVTLHHPVLGMSNLDQLYKETFNENLAHYYLSKDFLDTIPLIDVKFSTDKSICVLCSTENLHYGCPKCGELQNKWTQCREHLRLCSPELLNNKSGLQQRCMLKHEMCTVPGVASLTATEQPDIPEAFQSYYDWARENAKDSHEDDQAGTSLPEISPRGLQLIKERIRNLVACRSPLDIAKLPTLYEDTFHEKLNYGTSTKLEHFLITVPSVAVGISEDMSTYLAYSIVKLNAKSVATE